MHPEDIKKYIIKRYSDKSFQVQSLSLELKISESYLREIIYLHYNFSPHCLIETVRLEAAVSLFLNPEINIYFVCSHVGYSNLKTFRRAFKRRLNLTPKEIKQKLNTSENIKDDFKLLISKLWNNNCKNPPK